MRLIMKAIVKIFLLSILFGFNYLSAQSKVIEGIVIDKNNNPLPYTNVYILHSIDGAMTDDEGKFSFITKNKNNVTLIASMIGYKTFKVELNLSKNNSTNKLKIILEQKSIEIAETIIMGSAFSSESGKGVVLKPMDVITTPGGAADIFQSLKTMPGVTHVSESAELYVRGGDPIETVTLIDQASIYHPYTYESAYGGLFSNLNTNAMKGMYFSSGGFSSKYGNVLSGVLDIKTKDEPLANNYLLGISMAALNLDGNIPIVEDKFGVRFYIQQSFTKPIMWLNGEVNKFTSTPTASNININFTYKYSNSGRVKLLGIFANDKQGVKVNRAEFNGDFNGNSNNNLLNLQISDILFEKIIFKSSLSYNKHSNIWNFGVLDLTKSDEVLKSRTDLEYRYSSKINFIAGFEFENRNQNYLGILPENDFDIRPEAKVVILDETLTGNRVGGYSEIEISNLLNIQNMFTVAGVRLDYIPELNYAWIDPRIGLGYKLSSKSAIKFAWGFFHQLPDTRLFVEIDGNPKLKAMKATHYVFSYDYKFSKKNSFRIEGYYKAYNNLPLENDQLNYDNNGYGYATGIDVILKGKLPFGLDGWLSYGFIDTKRKWMDYEKLSNSSYDITHNFSLVAKYNLTAMWQLGINYKYATGRPYTPIEGSNFIDYQNIYEPIYGKKNSARYPDFQRLDFRITHLNQIFGKYFTVLYIEMLNILDINNMFGYTYNSDYSIQKVVKSYFGRRTIVIGTQINL